MSEQLKKNGSDYYCNKDCAYFPCHETAEADHYFNCMFCYCPLYLMGEKCGGHFTLLPSGIKDCSRCLIPHSKGGYEYINSRLNEEIFGRKA